MIIFLETFLIATFCFIFSYNTILSFLSLIYFMLFFSIRLWIEIIDNEELKKIIFLLLIVIVFILKKEPITFLAVIITVNFKSKKQYFILKLIPLGLIFIYTNMLFSCFTTLIFFYSTIKENYFFVKLRSEKLQDSLNKKKLELRKQKISLENENQKSREVSIFTERNRISGELHNSIGHSLSSAILQVNALQYITSQNEVKEKLSVLQNSLENGMQEIRNCIQNIKKEAFRLESSLEDFIKTIPNIKINLKVRIEYLPYSLKHDIVSIVKESVANILKHAQATEVQITIVEQIQFYSVSISDNGIGCNINEINKTHEGIGLIVLEEMVEKHNGKIQFYSNEFNLNRQNHNTGFKTHIIFPKKKESY